MEHEQIQSPFSAFDDCSVGSHSINSSRSSRTRRMYEFDNNIGSPSSHFSKRNNNNNNNNNPQTGEQQRSDAQYQNKRSKRTTNWSALRSEPLCDVDVLYFCLTKWLIWNVSDCLIWFCCIWFDIASGSLRISSDCVSLHWLVAFSGCLLCWWFASERIVVEESLHWSIGNTSKTLMIWFDNNANEQKQNENNNRVFDWSKGRRNSCRSVIYYYITIHFHEGALS